MTSELFDSYLPKTFTIETALACNLHCPECAIGGGMITRAKALLTFDQYKIIADKMRPFAKYVYLHLWGEPLLNKEIFKMLRYTADFAKTNISTNALLLDEEKAEALVTSGVTDVIVSIDGFTQEVYAQYRVGGKVKDALAALKLLQETNLKHGGRVNLIPQFIVFKHNQHEKELFREYCNSLGLQAFLKSPYIRTGTGKFEKSDHPEHWRPEYADTAALRQGMRDCNNPKEVLTMLVDGSCVICCHDYSRVTCFGNIFKQSVLDIWDSPAYRQYRWNILTGHASDFCVNHCMSFIQSKAA